MQTLFFRNDDVRGTLDDSLVQLTGKFLEKGIPLAHAVEPANLTPPVIEWLLETKRRHPDLLTIMQHGYDHDISKNGLRKGEFGGTRSYQDQLRDLTAAKAIMDEKFGNLWFPAICFPCSSYNPATIKAADKLGFKVFSSHCYNTLDRRIYYWLGHILHRGFWLGHHVSWHLKNYPGSRMMSIDMSISFIERYLDAGTNCEFQSLEYMQAKTVSYKSQSVVGLLLHHRYHQTPQAMKLVADYLDWTLANRYACESMETIFDKWKYR